MEFSLTDAERKRRNEFLSYDIEEDCCGVWDGYIEIRESGIGPVAYAVRYSDGKKILLNVEDCDNA